MGNTGSSTTKKKRPAQADVPRSGDHTGFPPPPPNGAEETRVLGSPAHISTSTSSTSEVPLSLNDRVRNHYVVDDEVLGRGQYGEVRKAKHIKTGGTFVVKTVRKRRVRRPGVLKKEMEFLLRVTHPNICNVVDIFETEETIDIVQDYYSGKELFDRIVACYSKGDIFSESHVCQIVQQVLNGIEYCHETIGICHRDLKPENILFKEEGCLDIAIIDFGLSATVPVSDAGHDIVEHLPQSDHMHSRVGTPYYMAPEVFTRDYGRSCDIWSIGVITYVLMCGYPPFGGEDEKEIMRNVRNPDEPLIFHEKERWGSASPEAKDFISKLMNRDPTKRLTAREALEHAWFRKTHTSKLSLSATIGPSLERFHHMSQLKRIATEVATNAVADSEEVLYLRRIFDEIDTGHEGRISLIEMKEALKDWPAESNVKIDDIFESLDLDGEGRISYLEFMAATVPPTLALQEENILKAFELLDTDKSGFITIENLRQVCGGDEAQLQLLLQDGDFCHDGRVSREEFLHMMKTPEHKRMLTTAAPSKDQEALEAVAHCYYDLLDELYEGMTNHSMTLQSIAGAKIGFRLTEVTVDNPPRRAIFVRSVACNSIAEASGLLDWDVCVSIGGIPIANANLKKARDMVRSGIMKGSGCNIAVQRIPDENLKKALQHEMNHEVPKKMRVTFTLNQHI